jgi:predicted dehydrogenase
MTNKVLNWGILGTARINQKIIPVLQKMNQHQLIAVASRSDDRAKRYTAEFGIEQSFPSYAELIESDAVDALYISLPNDQHYHWTKKALLSGKHVLCEKPLCLNKAEAQDLAAISKATGCLLMEGFMYRHHAQIQTIQEIIACGKIGKIQNAHFSFHFSLPENPNIRLNPENGGGALWDLGCYVVDFSNCLHASTPERVVGEARFENGVDLSFAGLLKYSSGASTTFSCSFRGPRINRLEVTGTKAILTVERPFKGEGKEFLQITSDQGTETIAVSDEINLFESEFQNFYAALFSGLKPKVSLQESIGTVQTLEALMKSARQKCVVLVNEVLLN